MKNKKWIRIGYELYCRFQDDEITALGAQLTYFMVLSFFPFLIFLIALLSYTPITSDQAIQNLSQVLPTDVYELIHGIVRQLVENRSHRILSFGMIATLWAASNGVVAVIKGLNMAYDEEETRPFWKVRGLALLFTIALALVFIFALILLVFGRVLGEELFSFLGFPSVFTTLWNIIRFVLSIGGLTFIFAILYDFLPNRRLAFKEVIPGSIFATLTWIGLSLLFSYFVDHFGSFTYTYGSLASIIVFLIWLYISNITILLGGEVNATFAFIRDGKQKPPCKRFGTRIKFIERILNEK